MSALLNISWHKFTAGACRLLVALGAALLFSSSPQAALISSQFCPFTFDVSDDLKPEIEERGGENPALHELSVRWNIAEGKISLGCTTYFGMHRQLTLRGESCEIAPFGKYLEICDDAQRWNGHEKLYVLRKEMREDVLLKKMRENVFQKKIGEDVFLKKMGEDGGMVVNYSARVGEKGWLYFYMRGDPPYEPNSERFKRAVTAARAFIASITPKTSVQ